MLELHRKEDYKNLYKDAFSFNGIFFLFENIMKHTPPQANSLKTAVNLTTKNNAYEKLTSV